MTQLRRATQDDLGLVQRITRAAYTPWTPILGGEPPPITEDYAARIAGNEVWLSGEDGVLVIEAPVGPPGAISVTIYSLAIDPSQQGRGLGRALMAEAERMARAAGATELRLYTNPLMVRNVAIYEKAGFRETGRRPNPRRDGWILIDMARPLTPSH